MKTEREKLLNQARANELEFSTEISKIRRQLKALNYRVSDTLWEKKHGKSSAQYYAETFRKILG